MVRTAIVASIALLLVAIFVLSGQTQREDYAVQKESGDWSVSRDGLTFTYPSDFGLAMSEEQILVKPVIPPCEARFDYCFYYLGPKYQDTNFVSAGVRVEKRVDLSGEACTATPPAGYDELSPITVTGDRYVTARFAPMGGAENGHYFFGSLYRVAGGNGCYELETRLGLSQSANYTEGSIRGFSEEDGREVQTKLLSIVESIELTDTGERVMFPK